MGKRILGRGIIVFISNLGKTYSEIKVLVSKRRMYVQYVDKDADRFRYHNTYLLISENLNKIIMNYEYQSIYVIPHRVIVLTIIIEIR